MSLYNFIATTGFGFEAVVKRQAQRLGLSNIRVSDGKVEFSGGLSDMCAANLHLRSADRIWLKVGEFPALSFDELFEGTKALPWDEWIPANGQFPVVGKSVRSALFSVPDCQSIVKKAVVEKLKSRHEVSWFEETGPLFTIQVSILKDIATLAIDTSGEALFKRGYRAAHAEAPMKETMAAALIDLSFWRKDRVLLDPMCGSGTIAIESALMARNIAPGLNRSFVSQNWPTVPPELWQNARKAAYSQIDHDIKPKIFASDINPDAIAVAKKNAELAGVEDDIEFSVCPLQEVSLPSEYGVAIINPPYGQRIATEKAIVDLYRSMGKLFRPEKGWSVNVITSVEEFEKFYGKRADAKRKLFNGQIKTDYYQFHGEKPM